MEFIFLGLGVWIATSVIVEGEIFRDVREAIDRLHVKYENWFTYKLRYLIQCPLCTGIWVAAIAALFVAPIASSGFVGWGLTALALKGVAHMALVVQKWFESVTHKHEADAQAAIQYAENYGEFQTNYVTSPAWTDCLNNSTEKVEN